MVTSKLVHTLLFLLSSSPILYLLFEERKTEPNVKDLEELKAQRNRVQQPKKFIFHAFKQQITMSLLVNARMGH